MICPTLSIVRAYLSHTRAFLLMNSGHLICISSNVPNLHPTRTCERQPRYCAETILFAIRLLGKNGHKMYNEIRDTYFLPSTQALAQYRTGSGSDPDGIQHGMLKLMKKKAKAENYSAWQRCGSICFDSMKIKQVLSWVLVTWRGLAGKRVVWV